VIPGTLLRGRGRAKWLKAAQSIYFLNVKKLAIIVKKE